MKKYNSIEKNKKIISDNKEEKIDLYQIEIEKQRQEQEKKDRIYMMKINNKEETTVENKKNEESIEKKKEKIIEEKIKKQKIKDELIQESKFEIHIKAFFKENILAKIGSILVFI
ncbi:MAG: hypothetical protein P1U46_01710 [Patescibacteria group bacterium]|nr:hypothetical protein [Patescibacteria group bacterium]